MLRMYDVDSVENEYKLCVLGDLNGEIGDRVRNGIVGSFLSSRRER